VRLWPRRSGVAKVACALAVRAREESRAALDFLAAASPVRGSAGTDAALCRLESRLARIGATAAGNVGIAALHLESGEGVSVNGAVRFPMASTMKVAIAWRLLELVDRGDVQLDNMISLTPRQVHPGAGLIRRFHVPGIALSLHNLLELMLTVSDNTAADILFDLVGGGAAITERLHAVGHADISVDRPTIRVIADLCGVADLPDDVPCRRRRWKKLMAAVSHEQKREAERTFFRDPRDTATPDAMVRLLAAIGRGEALSANSTALLLNMMARCDTGADRLKGRLPPNVRIAHKTGTLEGGPHALHVAADVGIIDLPGRSGRVAIAVFVTRSPRSARIQNRLIAKTARSVYDHFVTRTASEDLQCVRPPTAQSDLC
jgi:beta-lactamase class A